VTHPPRADSMLGRAHLFPPAEEDYPVSVATSTVPARTPDLDSTGDPRLERITRAIVERVHPSRIILFGSRARGDARTDSDYDLLVELESPLGELGCEREIRRAIEPVGVRVDVLVRKPGQFEAQRDDPGRTDWDVAREGVVVWPPEAAPLDALRPEPPPSRVREGSDEPPPSVRDWLARADDDLLAIDTLLTGATIPWSAVCFHAQQAAEKYLKVLLIQRRRRPPRTHDLAEVVSAARGAGCSLPDLDADCDALRVWAVGARYPENVPIPTRAEGQLAVEAVRHIVDAARGALR